MSFRAKSLSNILRASFSFQLLPVVSDLHSAVVPQLVLWDSAGVQTTFQQFGNDSSRLSRLSPRYPAVPNQAVALSALVKLVPLFEARFLNLH